MTQPARRVARLLHELLFGLPAGEPRRESTLEDRNAQWIEVYYRPGGVGPRRVLSVPADVLDECPMIDVPRHGYDYRLLRLES